MNVFLRIVCSFYVESGSPSLTQGRKPASGAGSESSPHLPCAFWPLLNLPPLRGRGTGSVFPTWTPVSQPVSSGRVRGLAPGPDVCAQAEEP